MGMAAWNTYALFVVPMAEEHTEQMQALARQQEAIIDAQIIEADREQEKRKLLREMFDRGIARGTVPSGYKHPKQRD